MQHIEPFLPIILQKFNSLVDDPSTINQATVSLLEQLGKIHHLHNKLLPAVVVEYLLQECRAQNFLSSPKKSLKFVLFMNCLRTIIITNFHQIKDNALYSALTMIFSCSLNQIFTRQKRQKLTVKHNTCESIENIIEIEEQILIIDIIKGLIISQIMLRLVQRSRTFFPQYLRFVKFSLQMIRFELKGKHYKLKIKTFKQLQICDGVNIPNALWRLAFTRASNESIQCQMAILTLNSLTKQLQNYVQSSNNKHKYLSLEIVKDIMKINSEIGEDLPEKLKPLQYVAFSDKTNENAEDTTILKDEEPIFLEQPIEVRELTPRFYNEEQDTILKSLRRKKQKLTKKIQSDLRFNVQNKMQERKVLEDVKREKIARRYKKEVFMIQKQTEEAKKYHKQMGKVKSIKKEGKSKDGKSKGGKAKAGKKFHTKKQ